MGQTFFPISFLLLFFSFFLFLFFFFSIFSSFFHFFFFSWEFGERNRSFSEIRTCQTRVRPGPFSEPTFRPVLSPNLPVFGERRKELAFLRTWVRPSSYPKLRTCQSSEFRELNRPFSKLLTCQTRTIRLHSPNSEPAKQGLYPFFLQTPN